MTRLITKEGLKKIQEELDERRGKIRQEIARAIKDAKEQGDLSENAEYAEAKRQQGENESRIAELEMVIKNSQVVTHDDATDTIQMGSMLKVKFNGSEMEFRIVGSNEADPAQGKISNESPLGQAFIGRRKGDEVMVNTPKGKVKHKILDVK